MTLFFFKLLFFFFVGVECNENQVVIFRIPVTESTGILNI